LEKFGEIGAHGEIWKRAGRGEGSEENAVKGEKEPFFCFVGGG